MELQQYEQRLKQQLLANSALQLKEVRTFSIPLHMVEVKYNPVIRSAMDILMKMMLITFKRTPIKHIEIVADILFVEPLFIQDLTQKMVKIGLLTFDETYHLTEKGEAQLASGIFEDELEEATQILQYSTMHEDFLLGDLEEILELEEFPTLSPYVSEELEQVPQQKALSFLQQQQLDVAEDEQKTYITSIKSTEILQLNDIPCIQFILYEEKSDRFFTRIYNVFTDSWDAKLEQMVHEQEILSYRNLK